MTNPCVTISAISPLLALLLCGEKDLCSLNC